jgi:hypothetical protein
MTRLPLLALLGATALSACGGGASQGGQAEADASTRTACRQRADEVYNQQNRGTIYSPASQVNTPFSNNYLPDESDRGLSQLFVHDKMVSDCVRNTGTGAERSLPPKQH